ncbi:MAG TPA: GxxExxY protein [Chthoniobacterales bacterium]
MEKDPQSHAIIGAAMAVHRELGRGFLELVYRTALALELQDRRILFKAEVALPVRYKGKILTCGYRADFVCFEDFLVEIKAISKLTTADDAQLLNELKATGYQRGLLLNFGSRSLEVKRLVRTLPSNLRPSAKSADNLQEITL